MSRDSLYQQLRGHLAYLKLTAAAEALPAELDTAMKTKATHTEFLERLLSIEVDATEHRSVVFNITGDSYRMRVHRARARKLTEGGTA